MLFDENNTLGYASVRINNKRFNQIIPFSYDLILILIDIVMILRLD